MLGPGIWREIMKNMKNEKCTLWDLEYGKKTEKRGKRETHMQRTLKMARDNGKCLK